MRRFKGYSRDPTRGRGFFEIFLPPTGQTVKVVNGGSEDS